MLKKIFIFFWVMFTDLYRSFFFKNTKKLKNKKKIKIAVLKPYFYLDLYTHSSNNFVDIINSSYYRLGPAGLFYNLKSDYYITRTKINSELNNRIKKRIKSKDHKKLIALQKKNSINAKNINYNDYDLIISYEGSVSTDIIKQNPKVKWAIALEDHSHRDYKKFLFSKPKNYDLFLNLTQGFTPYSIFRKKHCIDFSYTFGDSNFLKKMKIKKTHKIDIVLEVQQPNHILSDSRMDEYKIQKLDGNLKVEDYVKKLAGSKIFFCPIYTTPRWGNSLIEAALCQNLLVGNRYGYWNSILIHKDLQCSSINEGEKIIKKLLSNKNEYNYYMKKQNEILNEINFNRPLRQIYNKII